MTINSVILSQSPLHYWALQETSGTAVADTGGSATPSVGTHTNGPTAGANGPTTADRATQYDGVNDLTSLAHQADLNVTGNLTLSAWVRYDELNSSRPIVSKAGTTSAFNLPWYLRANAAGTLTFFSGTASVASSVVSTGTIRVNQWHHVAVTRSGTAIAFYIDGAAAGTGTIANTPTTNTQAAEIGGWSPLAQYSKAAIAHVALWNSALSGAQIAAQAAEAQVGVRSSDARAEALVAGDSIARITDVRGEALVHGDPNAILSTLPIEALTFDPQPIARLSQTVVEALVVPVAGIARVSAVPVEVLTVTVPVAATGRVHGYFVG